MNSIDHIGASVVKMLSLAFVASLISASPAQTKEQKEEAAKWPISFKVEPGRPEMVSKNKESLWKKKAWSPELTTEFLTKRQ